MAGIFIITSGSLIQAITAMALASHGASPRQDMILPERSAKSWNRNTDSQVIFMYILKVVLLCIYVYLQTRLYHFSEISAIFSYSFCCYIRYKDHIYFRLETYSYKQNFATN